MSSTNIRKASFLLERAGSTFDDQATIEPFGQKIYNVYIPSFTQEAVNSHTEHFHHGVEGQWLSNARDPTRQFRVVDASPPLQVPKVCISRALESKTWSAESEEPLHALFIVQGQNASERSKIVVARTLHEAATSILHEAINGYSVVFTGAMFRSEMELLFSKQKILIRPTFKIMPDVEALNSFAVTNDPMRTKQLGIIC